MQKNNFNLALSLLNYKQKKSFIFLFLLSFIGMIFEMFGLALIIPALTIMISPKNSFLTSGFYNKFIFLENFTQNELIILCLGIIVSIYVIKIFFLVFLSWIQASFVTKFQENLSKLLFDRYMTQTYDFHLLRNSSTLIRNIITEVGQLGGGAMAIVYMMIEIFVLIGISIVLIAYEPVGAFVVIFIFVFAGYIFNFYTQKKLVSWGSERIFHEGERFKHTQQGLDGIKDILVLGRKNQFIETFQLHNKSLSINQKKRIFIGSIPRLWFELLTIVVISLLIIVLMSQDKSIEQIIPILGLFAAAAFRLMPSLNRLIGSIQILKYLGPVALNIKKDIENSQSNNEVEIERLEDWTKLTLEDVSYKYSSIDRDHQAIKNINLEIYKGDYIGIFGQSGAGKSTLIDIILGLLVPTSGKIFLDDKNFNDIKNSFQLQIGYVSQSVYIIDDTIEKNIAFGVPDNIINKSAIIKATDMANLSKFIESLPLKESTILGEKGVRISGGQRQRIGIARALYHNPDILILDEATSQLDIKTESEIVEGLDKLIKDKTIIVVSHRKSTLNMCNKKIELLEGRVLNKL